MSVSRHESLSSSLDVEITDNSNASFFEYRRQGGTHKTHAVESLDFSDVDNEVSSLKYKGPNSSPGLFG